MPSLFVLGATGYIGGAVLFALLDEIPNIKATALVRNDKYVELFSKYGIATIVKSDQDLDLIKQLASKADIVLDAANADDEAMADAVLDGCRLYYQTTGQKNLLIHTSGTAVLADNAEGTFDPASKVYDDRDIEALKSIAITSEHRIVDLKIVQADEAGYVSAYVVCPSPLYGKTPSPIPRVTIVAGGILYMSKALKGIPTCGDATNVCNWTHIKDVASAYVLIVKHAISGQDKSVGFEKYYLVAGPEVTWGAITKIFSESYQRKGLPELTELVSVTATQMPSLAGRNARAFPGRVTQLGWKVTQPPIFEELEGDIDDALKA